MVEVKPINISLDQHSPGISVRTAISPTLTEEFIIHPSVYSEIEKLGHAKSDVLLNESESSLGAHAYAYPNVVSFQMFLFQSVIENSSYDLTHVKNFNTRNDLSSLIKDYKCNKIKSTKLKLSIILLWSLWTYRCGQRTVRLADCGSQSQAVFARRRSKPKLKLLDIRAELERKENARETGSVENKLRPGGPSKLTSRAKRMIVSVCLDSQKCAAQHWSESQRTPRKKPYISEVNRKRDLEFATKYKNKPMDFWKKVILSDESKFEIFTPPRSRKIWRKNKTALEPKNVLPTLKHGGGNVMVWGCVAHNGAGNLAFIDNKMNALAYIDVLRHNLLDRAKKLSMENTFIFQQDNNPKHTAIITKTWLLYHAPRRLETLHNLQILIL
ncbi:transposable element Tc1 transposase [Trichonephila clavipes]|nr:transposable element Tc1 transposase [Trichonephila clavipes]